MGPERKIQKAVIDYAREQYAGKMVARKNEAGRFGTAGWPDYELSWINEHTEFIEFKAQDGEMTDLQIKRANELRALGYLVHLVDNRLVGRKLIDDMYRRACAKAAKRRVA